MPLRANMKPGTGLLFEHPHKGKVKRAKGRMRAIMRHSGVILKLSTIRLNMTGFCFSDHRHVVMSRALIG